MEILQWATVFMAMCIVHGSMVVQEKSKLKEKFSWKNVEYDWPTPSAKEEAIRTQKYIPESNLPLGLDVWKDKLFITVPRFAAGVASTLNYVRITDNNPDNSPVLKPYPNWQFHNVDVDSNGFIVNNMSLASVFRVRVDECDRLWVMDSGFIDHLGIQVKLPTIYIFDLNTDQLIRQHQIQLSDMKPGSYFINVVVDVPKNQCDNAHAYVPDLISGVVVYSYKLDQSWRAEHNFFHFDPSYTDYNVGGVNFQFVNGIFSLALGNPDNMGVRTVYFHALSSSREFAVPNVVLQNQTRATSTESFHDYYLVGDRGSNGQSTASFLDEKSNVLFYAQVNKDAVYCWNANKPYNWNTQGLVDMNSDSLVFVNDLKVDRDGYLWVLSDRLPVFIYSKLNPNQFNYRILRGKVSELIAGTACEINKYCTTDGLILYPNN
ncbi:L-dopachrome tautomerase yellow-f2-like [Contarinia nasturtii]|uniref:L-dopachrome tautomerase yellow-f2-like n=1 Tax=Contarinia nasturtii TaxID=265458 RepID=UPI0012D3EBA3|nr:L-dopachrome tautomerase yellow-f2-like [Contarinia nasturtii]XP_031629352.1 L-dopachrome tautomerase yellow-f2-like [Contarinia nasturtii]